MRWKLLALMAVLAALVSCGLWSGLAIGCCGSASGLARHDWLYLASHSIPIVIAALAASLSIEWMRYSEDSPLHPAIKSLPHVAFEVDDLDAALEGQEVIYPPGSPSDGVRAAMILVDGAPVELIWFRKNSHAAGRVP